MPASPFVIVGHSLGGSYARVFATQYRNEVVGALLVDSFEPDIQDDRIHPLLGDLIPEYEAQLDGLRAHVSRVDSLDWAASEQQLRASSFEGVPLEVLVAARYEPRLDEATNAAVAAAWREGMESLGKSRDHIAEQIRLLKDAGVDFLILETFFHLAEMKVALECVSRKKAR